MYVVICEYFGAIFQLIEIIGAPKFELEQPFMQHERVRTTEFPSNRTKVGIQIGNELFHRVDSNILVNFHVFDKSEFHGL